MDCLQRESCWLSKGATHGQIFLSTLSLNGSFTDNGEAGGRGVIPGKMTQNKCCPVCQVSLPEKQWDTNQLSHLCYSPKIVAALYSLYYFLLKYEKKKNIFIILIITQIST